MTTQMATALDVHVQTILTTVQAALQPLLPAAKVLFRILHCITPLIVFHSHALLALTQTYKHGQEFFQVIHRPFPVVYTFDFTLALTCRTTRSCGRPCVATLPVICRFITFVC